LLVATCKKTKSTKLKKGITTVESSGGGRVERIGIGPGIENEQGVGRGKRKLPVGMRSSRGRAGIMGWRLSCPKADAAHGGVPKEARCMNNLGCLLSGCINVID
jgi:hypothetical protein